MTAQHEADQFIRRNCTWDSLSPTGRRQFRNTEREYEKAVVEYSIKNQLRYRGNLVADCFHVQHLTSRVNEERYYESLLSYSREHLLLYPYHLQDVVVCGLRQTPFLYYLSMMEMLLGQDKNYDSLPNFTAADGLRLLGIGRNQYIELMNKSRTNKGFFRRQNNNRELLPAKPLETLLLEPWWVASLGKVLEKDVQALPLAERDLVDGIIDSQSQSVVIGKCEHSAVVGLYRKGLIYIDVPVKPTDRIIIPTLEGFVMNRVQGDYFETLLYQLFVSLDEHTTVAEIADTLDVDASMVARAVSLYLRLAFARLKDPAIDDMHSSWNGIGNSKSLSTSSSLGTSLIKWPSQTSLENSPLESPDPRETRTPAVTPTVFAQSSSNGGKRLALLYDSSLTAYLMMGNLSPGLKNHAVTMFEVGKLSDESLDSFLGELERVTASGEGDAERYFVHALLLRDTIKYLRQNPALLPDDSRPSGFCVDLLRCESLLALDSTSCGRLLQRNYELMLTLTPLSPAAQGITITTPPHIGTFLPEINTIWFRLWIYAHLKRGPDSLLLTRGTRLRRLPPSLRKYNHLLVTPWGHESSVISTNNVLVSVSEILTHSPVLLQAYGELAEATTCQIGFPRTSGDSIPGIEDATRIKSTESLIRELESIIPISICPASLTLVDLQGDWLPLDCQLGVPLDSPATNAAVLCALPRVLQADSVATWASLSRAFAVRLLDFVHTYQATSLPGVTEQQSRGWLPFPTRSLYFTDGRLDEHR